MDYVLSLFAPLAQGAAVTLKLFAITLALALPLGLALALARLSPIKALSGAVNGYIWLMRGTPLMLQMLFIYFALPFVPVVGVRLPDFPAAVAAFALNYAAYFAEIFRSLASASSLSISRCMRSIALSWLTHDGQSNLCSSHSKLIFLVPRSRLSFLASSVCSLPA